MPELASRKRVRIATETTFGVEMSGSIASFLDLHALAADVGGISPERLMDEGVVQRRWQRRKSHAGVERPTCDLRVYMDPPSTALNAAASPAATPEDALGKLLYNMMGGFHAGAGSTEAGSSTASVINVAVGDGAKWQQGRAYGIDVGGVLEARYISNVTTDALTPLFQHSAAPTASATVYNAYHYFLSSDPDKSSQLIVETNDRDDIHWLCGLQGVPAFEISLKALPVLSVQMQGAQYTHDDDVGTPIGGTDISASTLTDGDTVPWIQGKALFGSGSAPISGTVLDAKVQIQPQWTIEEFESSNGVNGLKRWIVTPGDPSITVTLNVEGFGTTYKAGLDARTTYSFMVQVGNEAAGTTLFTLPSLQITDVEPAPYDSLVGEQLTLQALEGPGAGNLFDVELSPLVIARL